MILDYNFNSYSRKLDVSYIEDNGSKQILSFNVNRFKAYYSTPGGQFINWSGDKCDVRWVEKPSKFEIKTFLTELDPKFKTLLSKRTFPKVYTFDIETLADENGEYSEAEQARCPISTISICSPELNTIVLGTLQFSNDEKDTLEKNFTEYMENTKFFKSLNMKMPYVKYVYFQTEEEMLKYFLSNIVSKVPILTGWNCIKYDWNYIVHRIRNYYPNLSIKISSCNKRTNPKSYTDKFGNKIILPMPEHTLILDMMDVIEQEDKAVLPMKESMKLDYIASASMGIHKIEYTRSLDDLYRDDYGRYVFYNSIDSVLVQLINYRFKALDHIYLYALYCNEKIASCFSKIALTEALVFNDFYNLGIKIVYEDKPEPARAGLLGAYVKRPIPGIHQFVSCNDFAALYPSTMRTCNLSFDNYIGAFWDNKTLEQYRMDKINYVVIGPNVCKNDGTRDKPSVGRVLSVHLDNEKLEKYRQHPDKYFVTVNGCVYKNDKDYAFKRIQTNLQTVRDHDKYLGKAIQATVVSDIQKILEHHPVDLQEYPQDIIEHLDNLGVKGVVSTQALIDMGDGVLNNILPVIKNEVIYLDSNQLAMKLLMNSIYGGASHISFYWYNMNLANDITGEARNLIHKMEHHIPDFIKKNWTTMYDLHKKLGIEVDPIKAKEVLKTAYYVPKEVDPDTYNEPSFVLPVYGDTDSANALTIIKLQRGNEKKSMTIEDWFNDNLGDIVLRTPNGSELIPTTDKVLNYSDNGKLEYHNVSYIMRHKVTKPKWRLKTKSGKEIIVTADHSMIVFRNGEKITVKPSEILPTDKILVVKNNIEYFLDDIESCECIGMFEDEYVYDIEVDDETHTFIGNDILVHNSLYMCYEGLLKTIKGIEKMTIEQKRDIIVDFNKFFLDPHNRQYIKEYYDKRGGQSVHNFELETLNTAGVWLNSKKRYAQLLLWKDGEKFELDHLKMKVTGLEMNKAAAPTYSREILNGLVRFMLENPNDKYLINRMNIELQKYRTIWDKKPIDDICANINVNGYKKYIIDDKGQSLIVGPKCPSNVRGLGNYNRIRNYYKLQGDELYSGKMKQYEFKNGLGQWDYFSYEAMNYPEWGNKYAPIDRTQMFQKYVIDPINRILSPSGFPELNTDHSIQMSLF